MFYESIIGVCVLLYLLWKYLLSAKREQIQQVEFSDHEFAEKQTVKPLGNSLNVSKEIQDEIKVSTFHLKDNNFKTFEENVSVRHNIVDIVDKKYETVNNPLVIHENYKNVGKRASPPRERFAEFIEKTLCDDKIQSIIQNLSLDNHELFKYDEPNKENIKEIEPEFKPFIVKNNTISEKAVKLQNSIDEIADKIKLLSDTKTIKDNESSHESLILPSIIKARATKLEQSYTSEQVIENKTDDNKLLKRMQRQSGLPTGLNFGSLIGELKNKTKNASNGNLKPVFKKFDTDYGSVDDAKVLKQSLQMFYCDYFKNSAAWGVKLKITEQVLEF